MQAGRSAACVKTQSHGSLCCVWSMDFPLLLEAIKSLGGGRNAVGDEVREW